jgi:hypothetical protein
LVHKTVGSGGAASSLLSAGSGGADRDRTGDLLLAKQALSQLSYGPVRNARPEGAGVSYARRSPEGEGGPQALRPPPSGYSPPSLKLRRTLGFSRLAGGSPSETGGGPGKT